MPEPVRIFHISDLHFGCEDDDKVAAIIADSRLADPPLVCITGDIVNYPRKDYFRKARAFLDNLSTSRDVLVVPGNHDALLGAIGIRRFQRLLGRPSEFVRHFDFSGRTIVVFGINSTYPSLRHLWNTGRVTPARLARFRDSVANLKEELGPLRYSSAVKIVLALIRK